MTDELLKAITALTQSLVARALSDDVLRDELRTLARLVLELTAGSPTLTSPDGARPVADDRVPVEPRAAATGASTPAGSATKTPVPETVAAPGPLPELSLGRSRPPDAPPRAKPGATAGKGVTADSVLPAIEAHCRLKAEGVRWAATRHRRLQEGAEFRVEIAPRDREILDRAKVLECYLWMNTPDFIIPSEPALLEDVAGCFDTVADAVALVRGMLPDLEVNREFFEPALDLLAEAQSALRVAIDRADGRRDPDQYALYDWLLGVAGREHIYIARHMRLADPADPARVAELDGKLEALDARFQAVRQRAKRKKSNLSRLRYHAKLIADGAGGGHDWRKIADALDELLAEGVPASNVEVREVLLPIFDIPPDLDDEPSGLGLVWREIDRYLAGRTTVPEVTTAEAATPEVAEVARLLAGKGLLLIGGVPHPTAKEALKSAFGLKELVWVETRAHESIDKFEPYVARPDVALVLLAIRWASHSFGDVKRFCDDYGKPMVRLPGGYSPNQVAAQVLAQCSGQLAGG